MGPFTLAAKQNKKTQRILLRVIISTELAKNRDKTLIFSVGNLDRCPPMPDEARVPLTDTQNCAKCSSSDTWHRKQAPHCKWYPKNIRSRSHVQVSAQNSGNRPALVKHPQAVNTPNCEEQGEGGVNWKQSLRPQEDVRGWGWGAAAEWAHRHIWGPGRGVVSSVPTSLLPPADRAPPVFKPKHTP